MENCACRVIFWSMPWWVPGLIPMELEFQKIVHVPYLPGYASNLLVAPFPIGKISGIRCCLTLISSQDWTIPSDTASTVLQATAINWNWKERQLIEHLTRRFFKINGKNTHTGKNAKTCIKAFETNDFKQTQKKQKPLPKQHPYWSRSAFSWGKQTKMSRQHLWQRCK